MILWTNKQTNNEKINTDTTWVKWGTTREHEVWWINKRNSNCNCKSVHAEHDRFSWLIQILNKCCALLWQSLMGKKKIILQQCFQTQNDMRSHTWREDEWELKICTTFTLHRWQQLYLWRRKQMFSGDDGVRRSPPPAQLAQRRKSTSRDGELSIRLTYTLSRFYLLLVFVFELL